MMAEVTMRPGYRVPPATLPRGYHDRESNQFQNDWKEVLTRCFDARKLNHLHTSQTLTTKRREYGSNSWIIDSKLKLVKEKRGEYRITEKRREEIAAPAIVARMRTLRRAWMLSDVCFGIFVMYSIFSTDKECTSIEVATDTTNKLPYSAWSPFFVSIEATWSVSIRTVAFSKRKS
jgi:hypothetical protein